jgi:hypothetical protein
MIVKGWAGLEEEFPYISSELRSSCFFLYAHTCVKQHSQDELQQKRSTAAGLVQITA